MILSVTMNPSLDKVYFVDDFKRGELFRPKKVTATAGGKGLNVARVINAMGQEVITTGLLGGAQKKFIQDRLKKLNIEDQFVQITGETRTCINITDQSNRITTEILEPGPHIKEEELNKFLKLFKKIIAKSEIVTASGSLPPGVPADFYKKLIEIVKKGNKLFILDTSGQYLKKGIEGIPFMIKPNQEEVSDIFKESYKSIKDLMKPLLKFKDIGIEMPVITMGKRGALSIINNSVYHFQAPEVEVVNVVGSGDAFVAGCAVGLKNKDKIKSIKLGMAYAVTNTCFAETGVVTPEKVKYFLDEIKTEKIKDL